jgi:hypothetical protein
MFEGIENAEGQSRYPFITPGKYKLRVRVIKTQNSRAKGQFFVGEFDVLESAGEGAIPAGMPTTHMIKMANDNALENIKKLMRGLTGEQTITQQMTENAVVSGNPCAGTILGATAYNITTKAGNPFTLVDYEYVPETPVAKTKAVK